MTAVSLDAPTPAHPITGAVGQVGHVEVPHVMRPPTVAGSAFGNRDYAVCDWGRSVRAEAACGPGYRSQLSGAPDRHFRFTPSAARHGCSRRLISAGPLGMSSVRGVDLGERPRGVDPGPGRLPDTEIQVAVIGADP